MSHRPTSYLGQMSHRERAASVVLAMKSFGNLVEVYHGGYPQFMRICRPILRNWGVASGDYDLIWSMIEWAVKEPAKFLAFCAELDQRTRIRASDGLPANPAQLPKRSMV